MAINESSGDDDGATDTYTPAQDRTLSEAVLETIEKHKGTDLQRSSIILYDTIDADALNQLFKPDADPNIRVQFDFNDVRVYLRNNDGIVISVTDLPGGPPT